MEQALNRGFSLKMYCCELLSVCRKTLHKAISRLRYKCPVTNDVLRNSMALVVIRTTGDVVTKDCVDKIIVPEGMSHPLTGEKLK